MSIPSIGIPGVDPATLKAINDISDAEAKINLGKGIGSVAGGVLGAIVGSIIPGAGTLIGGMLGSMVGGFLGNLVGGGIATAIEKPKMDKGFATIINGANQWNQQALLLASQFLKS